MSSYCLVPLFMVCAFCFYSKSDWYNTVQSTVMKNHRNGTMWTLFNSGFVWHHHSATKKSESLVG